jgi:hypothetical protein
MRKSAVVIAGIFLLSMFSVLGSVSADVDGVFDIWEKGGAYEYVWWYNHDNSVCKGPEYQAKIAQLLADGYGYRGYAVTESTGGSGPTHGSYDEDYFVATHLNVVFDADLGLFFRTSPEGIQYYDGTNWTAVPESMEVPIEIEELQLEGVFDHDAYQQVGQHWVQIWGPFGFWMPDFDWVDTGNEANAPVITVINEDGTEAVWTIMDIYGTSFAVMVVTGEEEWDTRTIFYELPQAGSGAPQLQPKNYGQILNKPYSTYGLDEGQAIPKVFEQYVKYDGDMIMTYANSPLDIWFFRYVYQPNHKKAQQERIEQTAWYQKAHGAFVAIN